jgi:hypothetical protein
MVTAQTYGVVKSSDKKKTLFELVKTDDEVEGE